MPADVTGRSFALLDQAERDRLAPLLRPLAWIDGLITAEVIGPADPNATGDLEEALNWLDAIWSEGKEEEIDGLTPRQSIEIVAPVMDHYCHVAEAVCDEADTYRPYLAGYGDPLDAAAQWAAGFCGGISLNPEAWAPLFADEDARSLLVAIFSLVREEDMPEDVRADSPFRQIPPDRLERMRRSAVEMLPEIVLSLHDHVSGDDEDLDLDDDNPEEAGGDDLFLNGEAGEVARETPKVGRNDPCPCGSGKKYKECCLE
jgi:uncharacterized protein